MRLPIPSRFRDRRRSRGQSMVEFALTLPVILLLLMIGLDFGRVFLGWVNLNNTARIAANYAAANATRMAANDPVAFDEYYGLAVQDATAINCQLPAKAAFPPPTYPGGTGLGQPASVAISCQFGIITPIISQIVGSPVTVSASSVFPIRSGVVAGVPGGGSPAPVAAFNVSPNGGTAPVQITFTNVSTNNPTTFEWDFQGDGIVDDTTNASPRYTYTIPGTYQASLRVSDGVNSSTATRTINITAPPGPVANFDANPQTGLAPLQVTLTDTSTSSAGIVAWAWNFGNGTTSSSTGPHQITYQPGSHTVTLTVTDTFGQSNSASKVIVASDPNCTVPNFVGSNTSQGIQQTWTDAGFTTTVIFNPSRPPNYRIGSQSLPANTSQPCTSTLTVFK
jgi:PKD repeat protein